jgi:hypothetical protein
VALADNLISAWELDEASGNAVDSHGANDLTDTNTVGSGTGVVYGTARDFEQGSSEYFTRGDNADLSTGDIDWTIEVWVNLESDADGTVVSRWQTGAREYVLLYDAASNKLLLGISADGGSPAAFLSADNLGALSLATWYQAFVWHDSVNNQIGIKGNAGTANTSSYSSGMTDTGATFQIGANENGNTFDGLIGPVRFWKRVLSGAEHTELYNSGAGRTYAYITGGGGGGDTRAKLVGGDLFAAPVINGSLVLA